MAHADKIRETGHEGHAGDLVQAVHGFRYQVSDVARSVAFFTTHLGFKLKHQQLPAFANVALGDAQILLSGPQASGSRPMPDGKEQEPGGWNRIVVRVRDLPTFIENLKNAGSIFETTWKRGRVAGRSRSRILTAIPSSCSSLHASRSRTPGRDRSWGMWGMS